MKRLSLIILAFGISASAFSQLSPGSGTVSAPTTGGVNTPSATGFLTSRPIVLLNVMDISGSPYLSTEYKTGFVKVKSGYHEDGVPVRFNIYKNVIEFKQKGIELTLDDLDIAMYFDVPGDSNSLRIFKTGYPAIEKQKESSIYEVLAMGDKAHLLKYFSQKVEEVKSMGDYDKKELNTYSNLYLFIPGKGIEKIKADKKAVMNHFPGQEDKIEALIKDNKLNLKKENDLAELITLINRN